jgi:GNAT superfamily N-acetyltransferase
MRDFIKSKLNEALNNLDTSKIKIKVTNINGLTVFIPFYDKDRMGAFRTKPFNDGFKIDSTLLYDRYQNQGIGKGMYRYMINYFRKEGKTLYSDDAQSPDAKRVWDSLVASGMATKNNDTYQSN